MSGMQLRCHRAALFLIIGCSFVALIVDSTMLRCDDTWFQMRDKCFYFDREPEPFRNAEHTCRILYGGRLAMIKDERMQQYVIAFSEKLHRMWTSRIWIGAHTMKSWSANRNYSWTDGTPVIFNAFADDNDADDGDASDENDAGSNRFIDKCVTLFVSKSTRAGQWEAVSCDVLLPFLCEKDAHQVREPSDRYVIESETVITANAALVAAFILLAVSVIFLVKQGAYATLFNRR